MSLDDIAEFLTRSAPGQKMIGKGGKAIDYVPGAPYRLTGSRLSGAVEGAAREGAIKGGGWAADQGIGILNGGSDDGGSGGKSIEELLNPGTPIDGEP
ncbi:hypothetical protein HUT06_33655 [Actinomadura sp. NAK00032]|uniref:hypothetical protein n=1 Tax=Actinomadura sp. NAK00032 TaxID=2742128 RepID=UPI0015907E75|nr:hypothetical protein [Actinomadura sp. NAK00032]QKW38347.1 hypothetical protein HUT06_33655 [Actinomadura sp. NAK00032]